ncbi:MAG: type II secretion system protein [Candidatus Gastranaerophilales bacterium]|nr:type II secretion system protein [Candidatus Gastranaerophilales bacterium]
MKSLKKAFTLAEVLITLVIIGVIAALTIPSLLNNTNKEEYKTGLKKAYSALNQALKTEYALNGKTIKHYDDGECDGNPSCTIDKFYSQRMNIVKTMPSSESKAWTGDGEITFYTADGIAYSIDSSSTIYVDVNGDKKPNKETTKISEINDGFELWIPWSNYSEFEHENHIKAEGPAQAILNNSDSDEYDRDGDNGSED